MCRTFIQTRATSCRLISALTFACFPVRFGVCVRMQVLRVVKKTRSVQGLSLKTQQLYAIVFITRLVFKLAYEEDYLYACIEVVASGLTCYLIYLMRFQVRPACRVSYCERV